MFEALAIERSVMPVSASDTTACEAEQVRLPLIRQIWVDSSRGVGRPKRRLRSLARVAAGLLPVHRRFQSEFQHVARAPT